MPRIMQNTTRFTMPILSMQDRSKLILSNIRKTHEIIWNNLVYPSHEQDKRDYISAALCEDIMINIFSRLSVEDVWACKFVCGPWYRIISSRNFIENHLKSANDHATIAVPVIGTLYSFRLTCTNLVIVVDHQTNTSKFEKLVEGLGQDFALRASCDGLVLIRYIDSSRSMLYNPTTKELCNLILSSDSYVLGFFLDKSTNDNNEYKFLMFSFKGKRRTSYYLVGLRTKLWTRLSTSRFSPANESVHVGRNLFWMVCFCRPEAKYPTMLRLCSKCIMVFELDTESMYVMPHPGEGCVPKEDDHDHDKIRLWKMESRLAFTKLFSKQIYRKINIWVLQDLVNRSWAKLYEIDLTTIGLDVKDYPVEVVNTFDGELLLRWADHLYTYNMRSKTVRSTGTLKSLHSLGYSKENVLHFGNRLTYVKSLISPKSVLAL